ncbi:MAG: TAXI family TRAP transporter solute-binding subunit [Rhodospirillaceae bacterium]|nr:TAXI family TRAP transporter solute-binding subunit [Rhodospirillaceae bacterium]
MRKVTSLHLAGLRYTAWSLVGVGAIALTAPAQGQSVGIGTTKGGATAQVTAAIAKVVSAHAGLQMRPQPYANTSQYIPVVNSGKLEFAASNIFQLTFAIKGTGMSEGRPNPNLRMVATLMPFRVAYFVSEKSGIKAFSDLKGKRLPGFKKRALGAYLMLGTAANLNVSTAGWNFVQVPNFPRMWDGFKRGTLDAAIAAVGSKPTRDMKAAQGALRILPIDDDRDSVARMRRHLPQSYVIAMKANPKLPGLSSDVNIMAFDYTLWAHKDVKADIVYRVARAMHDRVADLRAAAPLWRSFKAAGMAKKVDIAYHPGAIRFYREKGLWRQ